MPSFVELLARRHSATREIMRYFTYAHLTAQPLRDTSQMCAILAEDMVRTLPDGPELTAGLRKLLEAKDCFVRRALDVVTYDATHAANPQIVKEVVA